MEHRFYPFAIALFLLVSACGNKMETHVVGKRLLSEAVYASGEILPEDRHYLQASGAERIWKILVEEGDTVKKGDVLLILGNPSDDREMEIVAERLALARRNADEGSASLTEWRNRIQQAKRQYLQDSIDARRYNDLAEEKAVSQKDAEEMTLRRSASLAQLRSLEQGYLMAQKELRESVLATEQQMTNLNQVREGRVLTSKVDGVVFSINMREGEFAQPGEPILLAGSPDRFRLELLIDERDIGKVKVGQHVLFETDAYARRQFRGNVAKVIPVLQRESRSFKVEATVEDTLAFFPQSLVEANIVIRDSSSVMAVPSSYLFHADSVMIQQGKNETKHIKIKTGIKNGNWMEIVEGLHVGDVIVLPSDHL